VISGELRGGWYREKGQELGYQKMKKGKEDLDGKRSTALLGNQPAMVLRGRQRRIVKMREEFGDKEDCTATLKKFGTASGEFGRGGLGTKIFMKKGNRSRRILRKHDKEARFGEDYFELEEEKLINKVRYITPQSREQGE